MESVCVGSLVQVAVVVVHDRSLPVQWTAERSIADADYYGTAGAIVVVAVAAAAAAPFTDNVTYANARPEHEVKL